MGLLNNVRLKHARYAQVHILLECPSKGAVENDGSCRQARILSMHNRWLSLVSTEIMQCMLMYKPAKAGDHYLVMLVLKGQ